MTDEPGDERLLAIAGAIARGDLVPWREAALGAATGDLPLIEALRALENIAGAQRRLHDTEQERLSHWAHLAVRERLSSGVGWATYRARDGALARDVSLLLVGPLGGDVETVDRLLREARLRTRLHHPNLAIVSGADYALDRVGLWSDWIEGETLAAVCRTRTAMTAAEAARIVLQIREAVAVMHRDGVTHGGITADRVITTMEGRVVLLPWLDPAGPSAPWIDIEALARLLRQLMSSTVDRSPVRSQPARIPRRLERVLARIESPDPGRRDDSAMLDALAAALRGVSRERSAGPEWIAGFLVAVALAALILWLAFASAGQ